jgi:phthiocerol/phenolphthiocerol synthesis type-I polyketide synthase C
VSVGLAEVWRAAGVEPGVVVGHSQGEVAAATVAGILTVPDAARVVAVRSRLAARARGNGRMLAVGLGADDVEGVLEGLEDAVCLAVDNSSTASVLSGDADAVLALKEFFDVEGVFCRLVDVDFASHSPHMDALLPELEAALAGIRPRAGTVPFMSTVDVAHLGGESLDAGYWARNLRRPVRFRAAMSALVDGGVTHVVEVSPHPVLATPLGDLPARAGRGPVRVLGTLRRDRGGPGDLAVALAHAYASGLEVRTAAPRPAPVGVPPYPLRRERHWVESRRSVRGAAAAVELSPAPTEPDVWLAEVPVDVDGSPWLTDHRVHGAVVVPGAALVSLALRTLRARFGAVPAELRGVRFERDLTLGTETARVVTEWRDDITEGGTWAVRSLTSDGRAWQRHATARARLRTGADLAAWPVDPPGDGEAWQELDPSAFYAACADRGLEYGPAFRGITALRRRGDETVAEVSLPEPCLAGADALDPHPSLLDAVLQTCLAGQVGVGAVVPQAVDRVVWHGGGGGLRRVRATCRGDLERGYDLDVHDVDGGLLVIAVRGLRLAVLADSAPEEGEDRFHHLAFVADERTAAGQPVAEPAAVLVCGDPGAAAALAAATGGTPVAGGGAVAALASVGQAGGTGHLVFAAPGRDAGVARQRAALGELAQLVRGLVGGGLAARVCVVTTRGQAVGGEDVDPGGGLFWGFARVLRREHPELAARIIDTDRGPAWAEQVAAELTREDDQVVHRDGTRHAGRITAGRPDPAPGLPPVRTRADQPFRLVSRSPGRWDGVDFEPVPLPEPGPSQVRVEVSAASLNFIDVMKAMGTYPDPVGGSLLGGECAGRVVAVGSDVTRLRVGDRVVACEFGSVASHVTVASDRVRVIPDHLDDAEAAVLPLVLVTAWYGLVDRAGLRAGETVLVHSAAGGLGLAALAVARAVGATVIATAGTEHKRQVLRGMGVTHVFDSGDTGWAEEVRAATGGRGVDVVLNSLTGVAIDLGLDVLAEDGRFVEVGKKDVYGGRHLAMSAFAKGLAFSAVDIAGLMDRRPERFAAVLDEVWQRVADGSFAPLPVTRHPFAAAAEVLREMATGRHVGKLVLVDPATVTSCRAGAPAGGGLRPDATYVVTGGLGALGLSLAEHLVGEGAGALALLGRREPGPRAAARIEAMRGSGADVRCLAVDVADADALARALDRVRSGMPPIRGVVHAAGVLADETIVSATPGAFDAVLAPKVAGAANLDRLTAGDPLDLFVLFSSAAALVGNPGQAAYAAANAYLDALAQARRAAGRPALSVQWGPFDDVGLAAEDDNRGRRLADRGMGGFGTAQAWPALRSLLAEEAVVAAYVPLDVRQWFEAYPDTVSVPSWSWLRDRDPAAGGGRPRGRFLERFRAVAEEQRLGLVEHEVRVLAGRVLRMAPDAIDATAPLKSLGLDSLMSLEYRNRLEAALGLTFPPTLLWTFGTTEALSRALTDRLRAAAEVPAPA